MIGHALQKLRDREHLPPNTFALCQNFEAQMDGDRLIIGVENYNFLYDLTDCLYIDKLAKEQAWNEIGSVLAMAMADVRWLQWSCAAVVAIFLSSDYDFF